MRKILGSESTLIAPDIVGDHLPFEVEFDDGAESLEANLLPQHLILAVLLHVGILININYEIMTEIETLNNLVT